MYHKFVTHALYCVCLLGLVALPSQAEEAGFFKPAIIYEFSGQKGDQGFIDLVRKGAQDAKNAVGIDYTEFRVTPDEDRMKVIRQLLREGYTHIVAVGFQNIMPVLTVAEQYPQVKFTVIDGIIPPIYENVQSVSFKDHEGAFLVGVIAASLQDVEKIGFIGGMDVPLINNFATGFYQGALYVNSDIAMVRDVVGGDAAWNNPQRAKALAKKQFNDGVSVIFAAAGGSSTGVLEAAEEMGRYAIGVDTNQNSLFPGTVVTSMVKRVDKAVYEALTSTYSGRWKAGVKYLGLREGALDYAVDVHNRDMITLDIVERVEDAKDKIVVGTLQVEVYTPY